MEKKLWAMLGVWIMMFGVVRIATASPIWHTYGGHEYALTEDWGTWLDAEAEAVMFGGHLAIIGDEAENIWITQTFQNTYAAGFEGDPWNIGAHIGFYAKTGQWWDVNDWTWISGEDTRYRNLWYEFPGYGSQYSYIHLGGHPGAGTWNNDILRTEPGYPAYQFKGIIERVAAPVPIPAAMLLFGTGLACLAGIRLKRKKK